MLRSTRVSSLSSSSSVWEWAGQLCICYGWQEDPMLSGTRPKTLSRGINLTPHINTSLWPSPQTTKTSRRRDLTSKPHYSEWKSQKILIWTKIHSPSPPHCSWKVKRILAQDPEASLVIIW